MGYHLQVYGLYDFYRDFLSFIERCSVYGGFVVVRLAGRSLRCDAGSVPIVVSDLR